MKIKNFLKKTGCVLAGVLGLLALLSGCSGKPAPDLRISEAMNSNHSVLADGQGAYHDWIELYNPGKQTVSLAGYTLSDSDKKPRRWRFPDGAQIRAGERLVVFCSGAVRAARPGELHTSFKLASGGETVTLCDRAGHTVSSIQIPELPDDCSCGFDDTDPDTLVYYTRPTPGKANSTPSVASPDQLICRSISVYINEYTSSNQFGFYDRDGDCPAWAELFNYGDQPANLGGLYLSDDAGNPDKWKFPDVTVPPGGYLLVLLSGKDREYDGGELHAGFKLSGEEKELVLSAPGGHRIDAVKLRPTEDNVSVGREKGNPDHWVYYARPTPGKENSTASYETLEAGTALSVRQVWINEVLSVSSRKRDVCVQKHDWVELYNGSDRAVDLTGFYLSDSAENPRRYRFPRCVLGPGKYLVLEAGGEEPTKEAPYQLPFRISNTGETLYLLRGDGTLCDRFQTGRQQNGISSGRGKGPDAGRVFFSRPTKGARNAEAFAGYTAIPVFSCENIYAGKGDRITLTVPDGSVIHYTTDGGEPTRSSPVYRKPIPLKKDVTIRAAAFSEGRICGGTATHTYLVDEPHEIAVICLSTDRENLFGEQKGIYADGPGKAPEFPHLGANYWKEWERPVHFEFYENDGSPGVSFDAGVMIFGQYSRAVPQKSLAIHLREAYGISRVRYPFFKDNPVTEYRDLLLRSSGQDWNLSKLRDGLMHTIVKNQMDLDLMDYRPAALYINGAYWGLYNLRDKINESYLETHHGMDPEQVDIIKGNSILQAGDLKAYWELFAYLRSHDLSVQKNYDHVCSLVDVDEVMNFWIAETFFANTDTGNIKYCRERTPDGKWRLAFFDLDWGLFPTTYSWDMIREALEPAGHGVGNMFYTDLLRGLMQNPGFRQKFIRTYACHLTTTFAPERTKRILTELADEIRSEIPRQYARWGAPSAAGWEWQIDFLEKALKERVDFSIRDLRNNFHLSRAEMNRLLSQK